MYLNLKDTITMVEYVQSRIKRAAQVIDTTELSEHIIRNASLTTHVLTTDQRNFDPLIEMLENKDLIDKRYDGWNFVISRNGHKLRLITVDRSELVVGIDPQFVVII